MHNELYNLYSFLNITGMIKTKRKGWKDDVACKRTQMHKVLLRKCLKRRSLQTLRCRWKGNITRDLKEMGEGGTESICLSMGTNGSYWKT
jgi:hypothetical protein